MKNKVLIILLVVFSLLLAGAIGFGVYLNMNFSTMIFEKGLDKLYTLSNDYLTKANENYKAYIDLAPTADDREEVMRLIEQNNEKLSQMQSKYQNQ